MTETPDPKSILQCSVFIDGSSVLFPNFGYAGKSYILLRNPCNPRTHPPLLFEPFFFQHIASHIELTLVQGNVSSQTFDSSFSLFFLAQVETGSTVQRTMCLFHVAIIYSCRHLLYPTKHDEKTPKHSGTPDSPILISLVSRSSRSSSLSRPRSSSDQSENVGKDMRYEEVDVHVEACLICKYCVTRRLHTSNNIHQIAGIGTLGSTVRQAANKYLHHMLRVIREQFDRYGERWRTKKG